MFVFVCRLSLFVVVCQLSLFVVCHCLSFVVCRCLSFVVVVCCCPGGPGGPVGQGCLGGQGGPGDQVCQCIWFPWSKQSNYRENLRYHTCDTQTDRHGKVGQYSV